MKYVREKYVLNQNIKRNHTKKYQHNMNIISFLKSNYKYKRRCTSRGCNRRRQQMQHVWRQQQTHPLPAGDEAIPDHRNTKRIFLCTTTKVSKFPRIFIIIMQPAAATTAPSATDASASGLGGPLMWRIKGTTIANHAVDVSQQSNARKDANEDTNIVTDSSSIAAIKISDIHCSCGAEMHYQHSNYDKVSTITSTPPLRCHRQKHNQMKSSAATTFLSPSSALLSSSPIVRPNNKTGRCFAILHHDINSDDCDDDKNNRSSHQAAMNTNPTVSTLWDGNVTSSYCWPTTNNTNSSSLKPPTKSTSCQSVDQYVNAVACNRSYTLSLFLALFIAFAVGVRTTTAGACWQTVLGSGKCNDIFSFNISKSECCGANQEFAYTDREPTSVEYFFATAIGGGMECTPCLESCQNVKCGPNKKCVKRKGRPKCVCAPECGATRRRRLQREQQLMQQHHSAFMADSDDAAEDDRGDSNALKIMRERSRQSRDTRSLSSEITTKQVNVGPENQTQNQRKYIHIHMQQEYAHQQEAPPPKRKNKQSKANRRLLLTANVEHTEKPTTRRIQLFSNVRTNFARRHFGNNNSKNNGQHEDTDPSEDYEEEEEYDDVEPDAAAGVEGKKSSGNDNNRNDDATRFLNQSLSRHKPKTNRNSHEHDLQTAKIQERDQSGHSNNSRTRQHQQNGRHAENTPNRHRPHRHRHRHHHHEQDHDHHRHEHDHRQDHDPHNQHHNIRQPNPNHNQNENHGRRKHNKQHHKESPNVQQHSKNHKDNNSSTTTTSCCSSTRTITNNDVSRSNKASVLNSPSTPTSLSTTSQPQLLLQPSTTPVNSTTSASSAAVDQRRYTNHGSKIATSSSSSLPLSIPPSSSSSSWPSSSSSPSLLSAASTLSYMQSPSVTMSGAASSSSSLGHANGEGVSHQPHHRDRDRNGKLKTTPPVVAAATTNSYNENDNTISTLHLSTYHHQQHGGVMLDSFFDQFDLHGFPKSQHAITITDSIRSSNPVCGTDGRTYNTECQLRKRACRTDNPNLQVAYRGHCKTTCNGVKCMNGLTCVEDQYTMPHCIACKIECPLDDYDNDNDVVDATRAVCGADGKTYKSMCDINRIICKIGRSIGVAYPGPCRGNQITCDDINCGSKHICLIDLLTHQPRCTPCRYKCSRKRRPSSLRFEEDKICGVNNRTYNSWCEMRKDSCSTGFYIDVKYPGHCH